MSVRPNTFIYPYTQALQNLGTALITMGAGTIVDRDGYFWLEIFFIAWLKVALISAICIWIIDYSTTNFLNLSTRKREEHDDLQNRMDSG